MPRGVARVFGARGADFRLAPPPRRPPPPHPPPQKKFVIHQNLRKSLKLITKFDNNKIKFLVGRFLVVGDHLDSTFPYFWKIVSVFCQCGGAKTSINSDFFEKQTKIYSIKQ